MQHVILVEDDPELRQLVGDFLRQQQLVVTALNDGSQLLNTLAENTADLLILDINLPGADGFELCRQVRRQYQCPILFLTARDDNIDQIIGFEIGADDYVIKPAEPRVLLARVRALLRRQQNQHAAPHADLNFGGLKIKTSTRTVTLHQRAISLTTHEFDILLYLAKHSGKTVSRDELYKQVIGREYDGLDRSVDVRISRLRNKLKDNAKSPKRIKTIWGKGFYFVEQAWQELDDA